MVLRVDVWVASLESIEPHEAAVSNEPANTPRPYRILLTPQGKPFAQADAQRLSQLPSLVLICGRYEGFDERVRSYVDEELSLGDFVLMGGEVAAMAVVEAVVRLLPGVLGNAESSVEESHSATGLLEYAQYTRPVEFRGAKIPDVLLSGHHAEIARFRQADAVERTKQKRPDLWARAHGDKKA
jgi:tRNA (guanine37-N1)-methyltransferase